MIELTGNEVFLFWLATASVGVITWLLTYFGASDPATFIKVPRWVLILCGVPHQRYVDHRKVGLQVFGVVMVAWATIVTILAPDKPTRYSLYGVGLAVSIVGLLMFETIKAIRLRNR